MTDIKDELKAAIDAFNFQPGSMVYDAYVEIISLRHRLTQPAALSPAATPVSEARPPITPAISPDAKWCQPGDQQNERYFLVRYDDPDCRDRVFTDEQQARDAWAKSTLNWNCWLFAAMPVNPTPVSEAGGGPYTCIKCLSGTWNDDDICDDCKAESDSALAKPASSPASGGDLVAWIESLPREPTPALRAAYEAYKAAGLSLGEDVRAVRFVQKESPPLVIEDDTVSQSTSAGRVGE